MTKRNGKAAGARRTCAAAVRRVLRERGVSAEQLLVALVDVIVDSHVDRELRERGLGPPLIDEAPDFLPEDALNAVQRALYAAELAFGKGFGRRPARGTAADAVAEQAAWLTDRTGQRLTPLQRALRHVIGIGWDASGRHLDRVDPPEDAWERDGEE
jgi:hypothetical protein